MSTHKKDKKDPRVDEYIAGLPDWQQVVCQRVRDLVHAADPEVEETIKRSVQPFFVLNGNICALQSTKDHVNIAIYDPIAPDPKGIINQGQHNVTARGIQVFQNDTLDEQALLNLFKAVIKNNRAGGWRKLHAGFTVVDVCLMLVVVAAIGLAGWLFFSRSDSGSSGQTNTPPAKQDVLADVAHRVENQHGFLSTAANTWVGQMGSGAALEVEGYKYRLDSRFFSSLYISYRDNAPADSLALPQLIDPIVQQAMQAAGYDPATGAYDIAGPNGAAITTYRSFVSDDTTCLYIYDAGQRVDTITCFPKSQIKMAGEAVRQYVDAYTSANPQVEARGLTFGPMVVKSKVKNGVINASETAGYDISEAVVTVNGKQHLVLYYNKQNGPWTYIAQANDEFGFLCRDYMANEDVRKAMQGQVCLSDGRHVRLDSARSALQ
jgi:hypothetical protein